MTAGSAEPLLEFRAVMARLRAECPWKQAQTHRSLSRYLLEEAHEALEAIDARAVRPHDPDTADHLCEELGDLLLQVYFHAAIAAEAGDFAIDDVARGIVEKMRRRNPHVFGDAPPAAVDLDAAAVNEAWQAIKTAEKPGSSLVEGIPPTLPALLYADKVVDRLTRAGRPVGASSSEEDPPSVGERLLDLVVEAHGDGVDPEQALRDAVRRRL